MFVKERASLVGKYIVCKNFDIMFYEIMLYEMQ